MSEVPLYAVRPRHGGILPPVPDFGRSNGQTLRWSNPQMVKPRRRTGVPLPLETPIPKPQPLQGYLAHQTPPPQAPP